MGKCPTPEKQAHPDEALALRHRDSLEAKNGIDLALKPYLCDCGKWHLGHKSRRNRLERRTQAKRRSR